MPGEIPVLVETMHAELTEPVAAPVSRHSDGGSRALG
jgi:hypothetical protein